jgi:hypothetical protein
MEAAKFGHDSGPALEIFSRYSRVEKASGETVTLKEYLLRCMGCLEQLQTGLDNSAGCNQLLVSKRCGKDNEERSCSPTLFIKQVAVSDKSVSSVRPIYPKRVDNSFPLAAQFQISLGELLSLWERRMSS